MERIFFEKLFLKIKNPIFILKYILFSIFVYVTIFFIHYTFVCKRLFEYFEINRNQSFLSQNSLGDRYQKIIETLSSIYMYEGQTLKKFIAFEVWTSASHISKDRPLFSTSSFNIYNSKNKKYIIDRINGNENILIYNSNNFFIGVVIPIYSNRNRDNQIINYKVVLYKKMFDIEIFHRMSFLSVSFIFVLIIFFLLLIFVAIPFHYFDLSKEINIEKRAILSIKNLIEHTLVNQESILKYADDNEQRISRAIFYNNEAQSLLKKVHHEEINIVTFLNSFIQGISIPSHINVSCKIDIKNNIFFSRNLLEIAFSTIINNAIHPTVKASIIRIFVTQIGKKIKIEISNNGEEIDLELRKKIFDGANSTKEDGHGIGLKNTRKLLREAGSILNLSKNIETTFYFNVNVSSTTHKISEDFKLEKKIVTSNNEDQPLDFVRKEHLPLVVVIEDEESIWNGWRINMMDANVLFFRNPDEFFFYSDKEKYKNGSFISKINLILCDYDYGNNYNLSNSGFFKTLDLEDEDFCGYFVLCSGFNESIVDELSDDLKKRIHFFYQKRPISYAEIIKNIKTRDTMSYQ